MSKLTSSSIRLSLLSALLFNGVSCAPDAPSGQTIANEVSKLRQVWKVEAEKFRDSKDFSNHKVKILKKLLRNTPATAVEAEFRRICSTVVTAHYEDLFDFDETLLPALVARSAEQRDRERLVDLLSANCPIYVGTVPLEFELATTWPDAIPLLFDCYRQATSDRTKKDIRFCLGRAFASLREQFPEDDAFVAQAKRWCAEHRSKVQINDQYPPASNDPQHRQSTNKNLFIFKE